MLLGNYGREQQQQIVGDTNNSNFEALNIHQQVVVLQQNQHLQQQNQHLSTTEEFKSSTNSNNNTTRLHHLSADQMLACQQQQQQQQQQPRSSATSTGGPNNNQTQQEQQRRLKPQSDQVLKCPRCDSMNTKFCYYNNYSLTQPRHFCKSCKRYWTKGGALRNVPVGGGCRKNKRVKQRQQDHNNTTSANHPVSASAGEELSGGGSGGTTNNGGGGTNDGASSSSILQQGEYPSPSGASSGLFHDVHKGGPSPFDRVSEHVSRIYSGGPTQTALSINWAGQMGLGPSQQTYDAAASMLGLNLPASIKQEQHATTADLTSMFDPSSLAVAAQNMGSYHVPMDNFAFNGGAPGEVLWRFPQPKLVSLLEDNGGGNEQETRQGILDLEASATNGPLGDKLKSPKGKNSEEYDQADSSSQEGGVVVGWQQAPGDGFFEASGGAGDTSGYWGNGSNTGWSSELHPYGGGHHHQQN